MIIFQNKELNSTSYAAVSLAVKLFFILHKQTTRAWPGPLRRTVDLELDERNDMILFGSNNNSNSNNKRFVSTQPDPTKELFATN